MKNEIQFSNKKTTKHPLYINTNMTKKEIQLKQHFKCRNSLKDKFPLYNLGGNTEAKQNAEKTAENHLKIT